MTLKWTKRDAAKDATAHKWKAVAISNDGKRMAAVYEGSNKVFISSDGGANWSDNTITAAVITQWTSLAMSWDGKKIVVGSSCIGSYAKTWSYNTTYDVNDLVHPIVDNGHCYKCVSLTSVTSLSQRISQK